MPKNNKSIVFVDRQREFRQLNDLEQKRTSSLAVIKGRRRVRKSRLIEEYASGKRAFHFTGLPPTQKTTAQEQRVEFCRQLQQQLNLQHSILLLKEVGFRGSSKEQILIINLLITP